MGSRNHLNLTLRSVEAEKALSGISSLAKMDERPASPLNTKIQPAATSSPRTSRKRTNDEVYKPSQAAHSSPPHMSDAFKRPSTAPEQTGQQAMATQLAFSKHGFGALRQQQPVHPFDSVGSTSKMLRPGASINTTVEDSATFQTSMKEYQDKLDKEYKDFEQTLNERDRNAELEDIDWDELEARYHTAMDPKIASEQHIMHEYSALFQVRQMQSMPNLSDGIILALLDLDADVK